MGYGTGALVVVYVGGGGKRDIHSHDHYDPLSGISVYRSPVVDAGKVYLYFDPIHLLPIEGRERWGRDVEHPRMIEQALRAAGMAHLQQA